MNLNSKILLPIVLSIGMLSLNAVELKREGWNLVGVCQDIDKSALSNLQDIEEIQDQSGNVIYIGQYFDYSTLNTLEKGYGYWVKGTIGAEFDSKIATSGVKKTLKRDGWNLQAVCDNFSKIKYQDANGIEEIQDQSGNVIYVGQYFDYSTLNTFEAGYGYWVKGTLNTEFTSYDGISLPSGYTTGAINNTGTIVSTTSTAGSKTVKIFANTSVAANAQANHDVVWFNIDGGGNQSLSIQVGYTSIVIAVYDGDTLVAVSSPKTSFNGPENVTNLITVASTSDTTPPTLSSLSSSNLASTTATISATSNEAGTLYYVVLPSSSTAPSSTAVVGATSGIKGNGTVTASQSKSFDLTGLTASTAYTYYMVAKDSANNLSSVSSGSLTTLQSGTTATVDVSNKTLTFKDSISSDYTYTFNGGNVSKTVIPFGTGVDSGTWTQSGNVITLTLYPMGSTTSYTETLTFSGTSVTSTKGTTVVTSSSSGYNLQ